MTAIPSSPAAPQYSPDVDEIPRNRLTAAFERRVATQLRAHLVSGDTVLVACSGGPDSSAALVAVARAWHRPHGSREGGDGGTVIAATFDHRLRPTDEVAQDIAAVQALAQRLGVSAFAGRAPRQPANSEAAAREARYRWLATAARNAGANWCVTGHTLDDQAETVLLRLARGTGVGGAAAMSMADWWPQPGRGEQPGILRPLLAVRRNAVERYLAALGVIPRLDPTNLLSAYARNRVRHDVLPALRGVNPRADEAIARFAELARRDDDALNAIATEAARGIVRRETHGVTLDRAMLRALPPAVSSRILAIAAHQAGLNLEHGQVEELLRALARTGRRVALHGGIEGRVTASMLRLQAVASASQEATVAEGVGWYADRSEI